MVGPAQLWAAKREFQAGFLAGVGLKPGDYLLDLGCGTLRGGLPLIAYLDTGHYYGVDVRPEVLNEAQKELRAAGLGQKMPTITSVDDLGSTELGLRFDVIWAFSVLIHMDNEVLDGCLDFVKRHLSQTGRFFANVDTIDREEGSWQGFPVVSRSMSFYEDRAATRNLSVRDVGDLASLGHVTGRRGDSHRMLEIRPSA